MLLQLINLGKFESSNKETYVIKSRKCPKAIDVFTCFEDDLISLVKNIEFCNLKNNWQTASKKLSVANKIIVTTEKTEDYKKYLKDNITKAYKKSTTSKVSRVNLDSKKIANKLLISHRFDQLQKNDKHIMVKIIKKVL